MAIYSNFKTRTNNIHQPIKTNLIMEKNRVSFEIARKLKDFGYTQDWYNGCVLYDKSRELVAYNPYAPDRDKDFITAPTLHEAPRQLRSEHKIDILPYRRAVFNGFCDDKYLSAVVVPTMFFERFKNCEENKEMSVVVSIHKTFDSFDDALDESVSFALELLEKQKYGKTSSLKRRSAHIWSIS